MNLLLERCVLYFLLVLLSGCGASDDNQEIHGFKSGKKASFLIGTADGSGAYSAFGEKLKTVLSSDTLMMSPSRQPSSALSILSCSPLSLPWM